ncbi:MAG: immunoglobulin domain-containing protein [Verrucomicrobiae bacterium]
MRSVFPSWFRGLLFVRFDGRLSLGVLGGFAALAACLFLAVPAAAATPRVQLSPTVYGTEHVVFIIDSTIPWSDPTAAYNAIYTGNAGNPANPWPNLANYFDIATSRFPGTYFAMIYMANTGHASVPNWVTRQYKASGISTGGTTSDPQTVLTVDFCRYNQNGGAVTAGFLGVLDHEIGHAWSARVFPGLSDGHWSELSTIECQMSRVTETDNYLTNLVIFGDPVQGFRWQRKDSVRIGEHETLSEAALYLTGLRAEWPTTYLLGGNVTYNPDFTMGSGSVSTFDHQLMVNTYGSRTPDYKTSPKRFRVGFVYIARDLAEVDAVYEAVETSAAHFSESEGFGTGMLNTETPFLCDTKYRGSLNGRFADLDGNPTPTLALADGYVTSADGTAAVSYTAGVSSGPDPEVSVVPASTCATIDPIGHQVQFSGLPDGVHFFTLKAQAPSGKKTFAHLVVEVSRPAGSVTITSPATGQHVTAGEAATFSVNATTSGNGTLAYQWFRIASATSTANALSDTPEGDMPEYSGTTTATLVVQASTAMDGDQFFCLVSDGASAATSNHRRDVIHPDPVGQPELTTLMLENTPALLKVNEVAPVIIEEPGNISLASGTSGIFTVSAVGPPYEFGYGHYQWQRLPAGSFDWSDLTNGGAYTGTTTTSLRVQAAEAMSGDRFRCRVSNTMGSTLSETVTLTVGAPPAISVQPATATFAVGSNATLSVVASGTGPLTYTWYKVGTIPPVASSSSNTLTISNVQPGDAGTYSVTITNDYGNTVSNGASLIVRTAPSFSMTFGDRYIAAGGSMALNAGLASSNSTPVAYQWTFNGSPISGASGNTTNTTLTYTVSDFQTAKVGTYALAVSNAVGNATCSGVLNLRILLSIDTQPQSVTVATGTPFSLSFSATGSVGLVYSWYRSQGIISGANAATYHVPSASISDTGSYYGKVYSGATYEAFQTSNVTVTVLDPPAVTAHPQPASAAVGQSASFSVNAAGSALAYQWSKGGTPISGATGAALSLTGIQLSDAGSYSVTVSNAVGNATSDAATLTVLNTPGITTQPQSASGIGGQSASFSVTATGSGTLSYQWSKDGVPISGATSSTLDLANLLLTDAGSYTVRVSNAAGGITSNAAILTVTKLDQTITFAQPANRPFAATPIALSAASGSGLPVTFSIVSGAASLSGSSLTPTGTGMITVRASQAGNATYNAASVDRTFTVWQALTGEGQGASPLVQLGPALYATEHVVFVIDPTIPWASPSAAYNAIYTHPDPNSLTNTNIERYFDAITTQFPGSYFAMTYVVNSGHSPVPDWMDAQFKATGINVFGTPGAPQTYLTVDMCRYNLPGGSVDKTVLGVFDHEIGHAWGAQLFPQLASAHWSANSTIQSQLKLVSSADDGFTDRSIYGDPTSGFRWQPIDHGRANEYSTLADQDLYAMGMRETWPTTYLLNSPAYNPDQTMGYGSVETFDHARLLSTYGPRNPDYKTSPKRFKVGFLYIARDINEVNAVSAGMELSAAQMCEGDEIDAVNYRFQVPFVCDTKFRGSLDGRLADFDGNPTPTLVLSSGYVTSADGSAAVDYTAGASAGTAPEVSVVPASNCASVSGGQVQFSGLPDGVHFFTIKAQTPAGKKTFAHLVVEVARPAGSVAITSSPTNQYVGALGNATFSVGASGSGSLTYQWFRIPARTSTPNALADAPGVYSGAAAATLTVQTGTAMDGDQFLCLVNDGSGSATSTAALLKVNEAAPQITAQPSDVVTSAGGAAHFSVSTTGQPATFGKEHYQWQVLPAGSGTWANLTSGGAYTNATSATLTIQSTLAMNGDQVRCVISNTGGSSTSNSASLTIGVGPTVTAQPVSVTVALGASATLSVSVSGTAPFTYQWKLYANAISGANSATFTIPSAQPGDAGAYTCYITNAYGVMQTNAANIALLPFAPSITTQPTSQTNVIFGNNAIFSVVASGTAPLAYQWKQSTLDLTTGNVTVTNVPDNRGGKTASCSIYANGYTVGTYAFYTVEVSNSAGSVTSAPVTLLLNNSPAITTQPANVTIAAGATASFNVSATGAAQLNYYWQKNGAFVIKKTSGAFNIASAQPSDAGNYTVTVFNLYGWETSNVVTLRFTQAITFPGPASQPFTFAPIALSANATSGLPVSFSVLSGPGSLAGSSLTLTGTGNITVRASQAGNATYAAAASVDRTFAITPSFGSWRLGNFSASELSDQARSGPAAVSGPDGCPNLLKYLFGLGPSADATAWMPVLTSDSTNRIYTFVKSAAATDVVCVAETSTDLSTWTTAGITLNLLSSAGGMETWQATVPEASSPKVFFRLRAYVP